MPDPVDDDNEPLPLNPKTDEDDDHLNKSLDEEEDRDEKDDQDHDDQATGPTLQVEIQTTGHDDDEEDTEEEEEISSPKEGKKRSRSRRDQEEEELLNSQVAEDDPSQDPRFMTQLELVKGKKPETDLEEALAAVLERKEQHIRKLVSEISKLKGFISKRKQTYKRKRKDEGAPTRALSAYNIFVQDRFARLAKENDAALKSTDTNVQMQRVPPANLVASTGNAWKLLPAEEKAKYEERAKSDRKRYEEQMAKYQPPDKISNRKRNKTGYNMFFSAHVLRLKQSEMGVPSERGSVARLVGTAWKALTTEEKQYYEREADKHNGMNPVEQVKDDDDDEEVEEEEDVKRNNTQPLNPYEAPAYSGHEMIAAAAAATYPHVHGGIHAAAAAQHDPRHHSYYYPAAVHPYYDYGASTHHHQPQHSSRSSRSQYQYPPPPHNEYYK